MSTSTRFGIMMFPSKRASAVAPNPCPMPWRLIALSARVRTMWQPTDDDARLLEVLADHVEERYDRVWDRANPTRWYRELRGFLVEEGFLVNDAYTRNARNRDDETLGRLLRGLSPIHDEWRDVNASLGVGLTTLEVINLRIESAELVPTPRAFRPMIGGPLYNSAQLQIGHQILVVLSDEHARNPYELEVTGIGHPT